jgi:hypothetical protein
VKLPRNQTDKGFCLGYHYRDHHANVHNSNMVGAAVLARTAKHTGTQEYLETARGAMMYTCTRQLPDGGWWYGEGPENCWIDNFHTGYNLDSLHCYIESSGDTTYLPVLEKGLAFYKTHFFEDSGRPKYYHTRAYPIDIQCAAQAIDTLATLSGLDPACLDLAEKVAAWTIREMQDPTGGYFYYRQYPLFTAKTPMLHWGQATMYKGLTALLRRLSS